MHNTLVSLLFGKNLTHSITNHFSPIFLKMKQFIHNSHCLPKCLFTSNSLLNIFIDASKTLGVAPSQDEIPLFLLRLPLSSQIHKIVILECFTLIISFLTQHTDPSAKPNAILIISYNTPRLNTFIATSLLRCLHFFLPLL